MLLLSSVWRWLLTTLSLLVMCALAFGASLPDLMPMPAHISPGAGRLVIDGNFSVRIPSYSNRQLADAVTQFTARVSRQTGFPITGGELPTLAIECRAATPDYPTLGEDESYQLEVTPELARLSAHSVTGALRGLQTFSQLIAADPSLHSASKTELRTAWSCTLISTEEFNRYLPDTRRR
jgi:hexosaminidase